MFVYIMARILLAISLRQSDIYTTGREEPHGKQNHKEDTNMAGTRAAARNTQAGKDWRNWEVGRPTIWAGRDFDGSWYFEGVITEKHEDHLILEADGMHIWIDDDFCDTVF